MFLLGINMGVNIVCTSFYWLENTNGALVMLQNAK